ncbi:MAG: hypothetical protein JSV61_05875 [Anaerolineales bacterium]|nr:MAG: hypothetical protein JSV61_05875 [Anaerolineales bacterium]
MNASYIKNQSFGVFNNRIRLRRGLAFGAIIIAALLAFEVFNYSTTDFAMSDLLGDLNFLGMRWATILAIAFCGIDFAGIARLFTPEEGADEPTEVWYLFGAWLLAATMNAMLTWWGVSIAILEHQSLGNAVVARATLLKVVPIFVAVMVWLIRVLIIGTFSVAGDRLFSQADKHSSFFSRKSSNVPTKNSRSINKLNRNVNPAISSFNPAPKPTQASEPGFSRQEPTYHPVAMRSRYDGRGSTQVRR